MPPVVTMTTFRLGVECLRLITLCALVQFSKAENRTNSSPVISSSVATHICNQQTQFQESGAIQTPVKTRPENDDSSCGWLVWTKCVEGNSESCPSFDLKPCDETETERPKKKGKGILTSGQQVKAPPHPCDNSTEKGLPNPQIVSSISKYPSVVTIETGDGCQVKHSTGLILNENWVIVHETGGFFLYQPEHPDYYVVVAGERKIHVQEGTEQRRSVAQHIPHPESDYSTKQRKYYKGNIGLVRLSEPLELNEHVQPIDLSAIEALAPSIPTSTLTIVGWLAAQPMKEEEDELLATLIESPLDLVPMEECYDQFMEADGVAREALTCAGKCIIQGEEKNQPMKSILYAQQNSESPPVPLALGPIRRRAENSKYGVFMNLASYIPWIKETAEGQGQGQGQGQTLEIPESDSRIIRGEDAPPFKYKSMVNLVKYISYACTQHFCGASILNEEWIVTAAHCVDTKEGSAIKVIAGDHDVSVNDDENEQIVSVSKIVVHENWNTSSLLNDIAVLKVTPPFKFNDKVQKVTLPDPSFEVTGPLTAIGWGVDGNSVAPHILQQLDIQFVPPEECQELYADEPKPPRKENHVCAGNATHTTCKLDSGGPLYQVAGSGEQVVVGLVSYAYGDACTIWGKSLLDPELGPKMLGNRNETNKFVPTVFTRVSYYIDWIRKNAEMADTL